jgi:site-specific DNA-methyltransferase (adenine-specific)
MKHLSETFNRDCVEAMKEYPDNYFDLAVVDPPYGISVNVNMGRRKGDKKSDYHKFAGNDSEIPPAEYFEQLLRISQNQIMWGGNYMTDYLYPSSCWLLWDKGFSFEVTFAQFEMAWTSLNGTCKKFEYRWSGMLQQNMKDKEIRIHETQKPIALYDWIFSKYATEGMKILDTHLGSGSSRISANKNKLNFVGFEIDKDHFKNQNKRYADFTAQTRLW